MGRKQRQAQRRAFRAPRLEHAICDQRKSHNKVETGKGSVGRGKKRRAKGAEPFHKDETPSAKCTLVRQRRNTCHPLLETAPENHPSWRVLAGSCSAVTRCCAGHPIWWRWEARLRLSLRPAEKSCTVGKVIGPFYLFTANPLPAASQLMFH
jgi:hypothetical protein